MLSLAVVACSLFMCCRLNISVFRHYNHYSSINNFKITHAEASVIQNRDEHAGILSARSLEMLLIVVQSNFTTVVLNSHVPSD